MFPNLADLTQRDFDIMDALKDESKGYNHPHCPHCDHPSLFIGDGTDEVYTNWWDYRCPLCDTEFRMIQTDDMDVDEYEIHVVEPSIESQARALVGKTIVDRFNTTYKVVRYWMEPDMVTGDYYPVLVLEDGNKTITSIAYNVIMQDAHVLS